MFSDLEIADDSPAHDRLTDGKLDSSDISDLVMAFRTVLGPIETRDNMELESTLEALNDTANTKKLAVKMAAGLIRLKNENFGVATLSGDLTYSQDDQRRLFIIAMLALLYKLPPELAYLDPMVRSFLMMRKTTNSVRLITVP